MITLNLELLKNMIKVLSVILFLYAILSIPVNHKVSLNLHTTSYKDTFINKNNITQQYK